MIKANKDEITIMGSPGSIMAESALILRLVYKHMKETFPEKLANELFTNIGKCAVLNEEELTKELEKMNKEIEELFNEI